MKRYYIFIIGIYICMGVSAQISSDTDQKQHLSLEECRALVEAERGEEALQSLLYYKDSLFREQPLDTIKYTSVIFDIVTTYLQTDSLKKAVSEIEAFFLITDTISSTYYSHIYCSLCGWIELGFRHYENALSWMWQSFNYLLNDPSIPAIEYCKTLRNICQIYISMAQSGKYIENYYLDAKWYIDEAVSVFEEKVGPLDKSGINGLCLFFYKACVYDEIGKREEAIDIYEKIINDFAEDKSVRKVWELAVNNRALIYMESNNYNAAIELLESCSKKEPLFLQNLTFAYCISGSKSKLKRTLEEVNKAITENSLDIVSYFNVAQRENFWAEAANNLLFYNNFAADKHPEIADVAYDNLQFARNLNLKSTDVLKKTVDSDKELKEKKYQASLLRDSTIYGPNENDSIVELTDQHLMIAESELLRKVPTFKKNLFESFHTWNEIRDSLHDDEIIIDFTYIPQMKGWGNFEYYYGAFVITKNAASPVLVSLCEQDSIDQYFKTDSLDNNEEKIWISNLYQNSPPIYTKIWGKLEEYIKDRKTIYFTPSEQLNLLNHNALVMPDGELFGKKYNLVRLSSSDKILYRDIHQTFKSAVIYGGIKYDMSVAEMEEAAKDYKYQSDEQFLWDMAMRSSDERDRLDSLPYTRKESHNIDRLLTAKNISTTLLQDEKANEESFKALSGKSPDLIHLATHGFYDENQEKIDKRPFYKNMRGYSDLEDQLLFTGVLMAGAKYAWSGNKVSGMENGILFADEISRLDLSGTKLVVLSACETAKGYVDPVDGVLGLQRGLKKAGVGTIVMSLWKVNDAATSELMTQFYTYLTNLTNLTNGFERHQALWKAMMDIREKYPDPYYWAGFVMLD